MLEQFQVTLAKEEETGQFVAIKRVFKPFNDRRGVDASPDSACRELAALTSVQHSNVISLLDHLFDVSEHLTVLPFYLLANTCWPLCIKVSQAPAAALRH
jgi:serine/threonine protein kinase